MNTTYSTIRHAALDVLENGLSVVQPRDDGSMAPDGRW